MKELFMLLLFSFLLLAGADVDLQIKKEENTSISSNHSDYADQKVSNKTIFVAYNQGGMTSMFPVLSKIAARRKSSASYSPKYADKTSSGLTSHLQQLLQDKSDELPNLQINSGYGTNAYKQGGYIGQPNVQAKSTAGFLGAMTGKLGKSGIRHQVGGYGSYYGNYNGVFNNNQYQFGGTNIPDQQAKTNQFSQQEISQQVQNNGYGQQMPNPWMSTGMNQNVNNYWNYPKTNNPLPGSVNVPNTGYTSYTSDQSYSPVSNYYTAAVNPSYSSPTNNYNQFGSNVVPNLQSFPNMGSSGMTTNAVYNTFNPNTVTQTDFTTSPQNGFNLNNNYQNYQTNSYQNNNYQTHSQAYFQSMTYPQNVFNNGNPYAGDYSSPHSQKEFNTQNSDESAQVYPPNAYYQTNFKNNQEDYGNDKNQQGTQNYQNVNIYNNNAQSYPTYSTQTQAGQSFSSGNEEETWQQNINSGNYELENQLNNSPHSNFNENTDTSEKNWEENSSPRNSWPFSGTSNAGNYGSFTHSKNHNTYNVLASVPTIPETKTYKHGSNVYTSSYSGFDSALEKFNGNKQIGDVYHNNFGDSNLRNFYASQPKLKEDSSVEADN